MAIADEQAWFNQNRAFIVSQYKNQYVVIKNQAVQGAFPTFDAAYKAGAARFGANGQFLVKQAISIEPQAII